MLSDAGSAVRAQSTLERELWLDESPADPLNNKQILGALFGLLAGPDEALAKSTLTGLFNMLECEDEAATDYRAEGHERCRHLGQIRDPRCAEEAGERPRGRRRRESRKGVLASLK
ncbi:MAG: hypothetical protein R3F14_38145 [Polyangiaceae bacterium]